MKRIVRDFFVLSFAAVVFAGLSGLAQAQRVDVAFGISTLDGPGASAGNSIDHPPVSITGGAYPGFSGDVMAFHNMGVGAEIFWKADQGNYGGQGTGFRPVLWNINAIYSPKLASHTYLELVGGIGAQSTRYYCGANCFNPYTGSDYVSSNHFDGDFGGGIKFYPARGFFVRPEARFYVVNNNTDFSSNHFTRYGVSIGYTFGRH